MTNAYSLFRSLVIYGVALPLAIFIGYLLANPIDFTTFISGTLVLGVLLTPLLLRWHYPWLLLSWNSTFGFYFLPGRPSFVMALIAASFGISFLSYIMNRKLRFISVPSLTWPLLFILAVSVATAELTGGIGLNVLGSSGVGGRRYIVLWLGILGYFALVARRIPPEKSNLYTNLYFLGGVTSVVGHLAAVVGPAFYFIFMIFPPDLAGMLPSNLSAGGPQITRLTGMALASIALISWLLARHGLRGLLDSKKWWRLPLFLLFFVATMFGGFRSMLMTVVLLCAVLFYMEGLVHTRLLPTVVLAVLLAGAIIVPFANKLPLSMQRSLAFLPLDLDTEAVLSAKESTDWRLEMWRDVLPAIPQYLILGKGLGIDAGALDMEGRGLNRGEIGAAGSELAGDYHNGPLSIIIPFGIFGVLGFLWFIGASLRVLYRNYKFGDPANLTVNRFLLAYFIVRIITFVFVFGAFTGDMLIFTGMVGLSVALNGGMRSPAVEPVVRPTFRRLTLAGAAAGQAHKV